MKECFNLFLWHLNTEHIIYQCANQKWLWYCGQLKSLSGFISFYVQLVFVSIRPDATNSKKQNKNNDIWALSPKCLQNTTIPQTSQSTKTNNRTYTRILFQDCPHQELYSLENCKLYSSKKKKTKKCCNSCGCWTRERSRQKKMRQAFFQLNRPETNLNYKRHGQSMAWGQKSF